MLGGMIYLYREPLQRLANRFGGVVALLIGCFCVVYFVLGSSVPVMLVLYGLLLVFALREKQYRFDVFDNPVTNFLSGIGMEIYLSHMMVFRALEKFVFRNCSQLKMGSCML